MRTSVFRLLGLLGIAVILSVTAALRRTGHDHRRNSLPDTPVYSGVTESLIIATLQTHPRDFPKVISRPFAAIGGDSRGGVQTGQDIQAVQPLQVLSLSHPSSLEQIRTLNISALVDSDHGNSSTNVLPVTTARDLHFPRTHERVTGRTNLSLLEPLRVTFCTTLKPVGRSVQLHKIQLTALLSWLRTAPLRPTSSSWSPGARHVDVRAVVFGDGDGIAKLVSEVGPGCFHKPDVPSGLAGTVLLGTMFRAAELDFPDTNIFIFVNADIIMPPSLANALNQMSSRFSSYFAVGARYAVQTSDASDDALPVDVSGWWDQDGSVLASGWLANVTLKADRVDAQDFFIWTAGFFGAAVLPQFHIGRPAFDNWLVNRAVHSGHPTVDVSNMILAVHQNHDYSHLKLRTYWSSEEQKENYVLAKANGGWKDGKIENTEWLFSGAGCSIITPSACKLSQRPATSRHAGTSHADRGHQRQHMIRGVYQPVLPRL